MRSPAAAIAWELGWRHRWGLAAVGLYFALLVTVRLLVFGSGPRVVFDDDSVFAFLVIVPLSCVVMYFLALFSFGFSGDLGAPASAYPTRMFTLPIADAALVGWPMLYGSLAMGLLWLATRLLAVWPVGAHVPLVWPALAGVVYLVWTQVLTWMPYRLPGLRVLATVLWLSLISIGGVFALDMAAPERVMLALLAPQVPLAYLVARYGVARARRGETPDLRGLFSRRWLVGSFLARDRGRFTSPGQAQTWFEWRRFGRSLPVLVAFVLPFELSMLVIFRDATSLVYEALLVVLLTPPVLAAFVAANVARSGAPHGRSCELGPFLAARPLSSTGVVTAKLTAAAWSSLVAWALVGAILPPALWLTGTWPTLVRGLHDVVDVTGGPRAVAIALLGLALLLLSTWKQLVRSLYIGMSGRPWLVRASVLAGVVVLTGLVPLLAWLDGNLAAVTALVRALPWVLAVLVCCKVAAIASITVRLYDSRLVSDRALVAGVAGWLVAVLALFAVMLWIVDLPPSMPRHLFAQIAILTIPFARLSAAPLALARNRHRGRGQPTAAPVVDTGRKAIVVGAVLLLIGAPAVVAVAGTVSYHLANRSNGTIVSSGEQREYLLYVPDSYDPATRVPLVISLHGGATWPAQQMRLSGWNRLADEDGFIVVYPAGTGSPRKWETFDAGEGLVRDVRFIVDLIDELQTAYAIDPSRIYANGLSNGGGMAFVLACTLADRVAAVGLVAPAQTLPPDWCAGARPVPLIAFQGTADRFVRYEGGPMADPVNPNPPVFPATMDWVGRWVVRNHCRPTAVESRVANDVTRLEYPACAEGAAVVLYTIDGGGHTWPGGEPLPGWFAGATSDSVDATRRMWAFFRRHPLPR